MFERAWKKFESKETSKAGVGSSVSSLPPVRSESQGTGSRISRMRSRSRGTIPERFAQRLSAEQKCDIAQREIERYRTEIRKINEGTSKALSNLKVMFFYLHLGKYCLINMRLTRNLVQSLSCTGLTGYVFPQGYLSITSR